jgi:hypothetical protein
VKSCPPGQILKSTQDTVNGCWYLWCSEQVPPWFNTVQQPNNQRSGVRPSIFSQLFKKPNSRQSTIPTSDDKPAANQGFRSVFYGSRSAASPRDAGQFSN